ncbi:MAG: decarboxylating 6-phosphogluconate dehydrogenase [Actinobacteria bacterium]|nr:decarboxylating 6-phosphogluconate dehydrogenase [Actinomycetota bacterium]
MRIGMIGLGRMGANMAERLRRAGHEVVGFDPKSEQSDATSLEDLVERLGAAGSRIAWSMVPAGGPTDETVTRLCDLMSEGDVVVDGGNSNFEDSIRSGGMLAERGVGFVDAGTSGGIWGLEYGYALMVGGEPDVVAKVWPALEALSPGEGRGLAHVGPVGAGHYTKMVHNGVEYGMMQALAEGYAVLAKSDLGIDVPAALGSWQHGSVVRSWLLDLLVRAVDDEGGIEAIAPFAADSGEGRWTIAEAIRLGVAAPVMSAALFARFVSQDPDDVEMRVVAALRKQFGGHPVHKATAEDPS